MEIIGTSLRETIILTATRDEIANLIGYYYPGSDGCPRLDVGLKIKVSEMYHRLRSLADRKDTVASAAKMLRAYADMLELVPPIELEEAKPTTETKEA